MIEIKLKRILCTVLVLVFLSSSLVYAEGESLTLKDAVKKATESSLEIMRYTNAVARYQRDYADSLATSRQIDDMLKLDARFRKLSLSPPKDYKDQIEYEMLSSVFQRYMSASQRLDMEISSELTPKTMEYMLNVNKALLKSAKENVYLTIYQSFNDITKADDAIKVKVALVNNLESNYKTASAKFAQGKLSVNSINTIKLELQKARIELNTLQIEKKKAVIKLNKALGNPIDYQYVSYVNENIRESIAIGNLQEYIDTAYKNNEDYKSAKQYFDIKKKEYDMLTAFYGYEDSIKNMDAYIEFNNAKEQFETVDISLQLRVLNTFTKFQNQLTNLERSKLAFDVSGKKLLEVKSKYNLGLATELEVSEAYTDYNESQLNYLSAQRDTWLTKLNLDLICGVAANNN